MFVCMFDWDWLIKGGGGWDIGTITIYIACRTISAHTTTDRKGINRNRTV